MKVTQELVTVWADPDAEEVNVVVGGVRLTLTPEESALLAGGLARSLERLRSPHGKDAAEAVRAADPVLVRKDEPPPSAETDSMQLRTRALIQASIRDKGLSLREETRS
ncbi:MAG TPA: hypothetical protein VFA22_06905 [Stellaceae bacterium]|nr:hypothetical protein [Stellaceae bacterium]